MAKWALTHVGSRGEYDRDGVSHFFDSLSLPVREEAWHWLEQPDCPGADDPVLFCRLLETPFDDLKLRVVDLLERRNLPGEARSGLVSVWSAVLLGVHRGGRQKLKATKQLAEALVKSPHEADNLLPILAAAVRSSRRPEARAALAAVVGALAGCPELCEPLATYLPELSLPPVEARMNVSVAYQGRSGLVPGAAGEQLLRFAPNLNRDAVAFDAALRHPLRFREAISALHEVVINDLRFKPHDREAYELWKRDERQREAKIRTTEYQRLKQEVLAARPDIAPDLEQQYFNKRKRYWSLRDSFSRQLSRRNPELWRQLMPCDPVVTVADDVVFFECFSADQSSYGCLTLDRAAALGKSEGLQFGTTNVDYSWALFDHFQTLRSYRETRLKVDPAGFARSPQAPVNIAKRKSTYRRAGCAGFMQVQSAMTLPMRRVTLSRDALYAILAWLRRHKAQAQSTRLANRTGCRPAAHSGARAVGRTHRVARRRMDWSHAGADSRVGGAALAVARATVAAGQLLRSRAAGHRSAFILDRADGRDAVNVGAQRLDDQRLERRLGARSARAAGDRSRRALAIRCQRAAARSSAGVCRVAVSARL